VSEVAARNKRNRRAGARWQSDLREGFRGEGFDIERLVLTGKEDEGDLVIRQPIAVGMPPEYVVIEAKAGALHPAEFVREAQVERLHFAKHRGLDLALVTGIAVVKRVRSNWKDAYVLTTVRDYFRLGDS
jgi:hypothetical protein